MKKITLFAVCLVTINFGLINAQMNQGNVLIGLSSTLSIAGSGSDMMSLGYSTTKEKSDAVGFEESDPDKTMSINLIPRIGYFVQDNFVVGLDINYGFMSTKNGEIDYRYSQTLISGGPFIRCYAPAPEVFPFFEIGGSYGIVKEKEEFGDDFLIPFPDSENKSSVLTLGGGIGVAVPLGDRVMIDVMGGYNSITVKDNEDNPDNERVTVGTLGLKLGFTVLLEAN